MPARHAQPLSPLRGAELSRLASRHTREIGIAAFGVLVLGLGASAAAAGRTSAAAPRALSFAAQVHAAPARTLPTVPTPSPGLRAAPVTAAHPRRAHRTVAAPPAPPWIPRGTGMWIHQWPATEGGHAAQVVGRAVAAGLSVLYVQTGDSKEGWIGSPVLSQLLPATRGTGIRVVAWDFPTLKDPAGDARRLARAAWFHRSGSPWVAAVAPDVETGSEGTQLSGAAIQVYYATLRKALPAGVGILATVPWPSQYRINSYPYARTAPHVDAFLPMDYWYNNPPGAVTATSIRVLRRYGKPVLPVGQGYDGRLDAPYLKADPAPDRSVQAFIDAARSLGAPSVSLWSWQTTGSKQWRVLSRARATFRAAPGLSVGARNVGG